MLAGSVRAQKLESVFSHSCSWCIWHHRGVSLLSDLFVGLFGVDVSIFTWNQVRCSGQSPPCWCSQAAACAGDRSVRAVESQPASPWESSVDKAPSLGNARASRDGTAQLLHLCGMDRMCLSCLRRWFGKNICLKWILLSSVTTILLLFWAAPQRILGSFLCGVS